MRLPVGPAEDAVTHSGADPVSKALAAMICLALSLVGWPAQAVDFKAARMLNADLDSGRQIYAHCVACHQPEGWGLPDGSIPQIAGQHPRVIIRQLEHFRKGYRKSPQMEAVANMEHLSSAQSMADVAGYIYRLPMTPMASHGDGKDLVRGEALFRTACASRCHGANGEGSNWRLWPRLQGQHYAYLLKQMYSIRRGERRFADNLMVTRLNRFSDQDMVAVADFLSRVPPPPERAAPQGWSNPDFPAR